MWGTAEQLYLLIICEAALRNLQFEELFHPLG